MIADHSKALSCADCGAGMRLVPNGRFGPFYSCTNFPQCRGIHGAHADGRPLGTPGTAAVRALRIRAHEAFDRLWLKANSKNRQKRRAAAYAALARFLDTPRSACHIGDFDAETCARVITWADGVVAARQEQAAAERAKHDAKPKTLPSLDEWGAQRNAEGKEW